MIRRSLTSRCSGNEPALTPEETFSGGSKTGLEKTAEIEAILFSEERERKATRDSAVSQALVRREKSTRSFFSPFPTLALLYTFALLRKNNA